MTKKKAEKIVYAPNLEKAAKRIERALKGLDGVTYQLHLVSYWWPDQPLKLRETLYVELWFFRNFRKTLQCGDDLGWAEKYVREQAEEQLAKMREAFTKKVAK